MILIKIVETERLVVREYNENDVNDLTSILSDPITMSYWASPFSKDQVEEWMERNIKSYSDLSFGRWAIILKKTGRIIGDCGIMRTCVDEVLENDLGYIVDRHHWNQGYAFEAAGACKEYAFDTVNLKRLVANMATDHVRSRNVAIKLGMTLEKTFANRRNRNIPTYLYSLTTL